VAVTGPGGFAGFCSELSFEFSAVMKRRSSSVAFGMIAAGVPPGPHGTHSSLRAGLALNILGNSLQP
jgi:hypothetical protein